MAGAFCLSGRGAEKSEDVNVVDALLDAAASHIHACRRAEFRHRRTVVQGCERAALGGIETLDAELSGTIFVDGDRRGGVACNNSASIQVRVHDE